MRRRSKRRAPCPSPFSIRNGSYGSGLCDAATQASIWRRYRITSLLEGSRDPFNDVTWTVFFDHPDYVPTKALEHLRSPDVLYVLLPVCSVLFAVVLESDHLTLPAHIQVRDELAMRYSNLGGRWGKSSNNQDKPQPGFPRGFGTGAH